MDRRALLKTLTVLPIATVAGALFAAPATRAKLLVVFLRGGYDAANLLIPVSSDFYYQARPNIAVPRPGSDTNAASATWDGVGWSVPSLFSNGVSRTSAVSCATTFCIAAISVADWMRLRLA